MSNSPVSIAKAANASDSSRIEKAIANEKAMQEKAASRMEELEKELNSLKDAMKTQGVYFTIDEDNQNEVVKEVFDRLTDSLEKVKTDANQRATDIVAQAKEEANLIVRRAKENSVEIRTQNVTIMRNLKSIGEMIDVILEKGIQ